MKFIFVCSVAICIGLYVGVQSHRNINARIATEFRHKTFAAYRMRDHFGLYLMRRGVPFNVGFLNYQNNTWLDNSDIDIQVQLSDVKYTISFKPVCGANIQIYFNSRIMMHNDATGQIIESIYSALVPKHKFKSYVELLDWVSSKIQKNRFDRWLPKIKVRLIFTNGLSLSEYNNQVVLDLGTTNHSLWNIRFDGYVPNYFVLFQNDTYIATTNPPIELKMTKIESRAAWFTTAYDTPILMPTGCFMHNTDGQIDIRPSWLEKLIDPLELDAIMCHTDDADDPTTPQEFKDLFLVMQEITTRIMRQPSYLQNMVRS
jgi:hypothetical protein